jgi:hypothetical protein
MDRWYREKYKIQFNSPEHRIVNLIDVCFEFIEDMIYEDILEDRIDNVYIPDRGEFLKNNDTVENWDQYDNEQLINAFNNID